MKLELSIGGQIVKTIELLNDSNKDQVSAAASNMRHKNEHLINAGIERGLPWEIVMYVQSAVRNRDWPLMGVQAERWKAKFGPHSLSPLGYLRPF